MKRCPGCGKVAERYDTFLQEQFGTVSDELWLDHEIPANGRDGSSGQETLWPQSVASCDRFETRVVGRSLPSVANNVEQALQYACDVDWNRRHSF